MAEVVRVSTLHSLALRALRAARLLEAYPTEPLVLDQWELENVFDAEFGQVAGLGKERREQIRQHHEAFWSTGQWDPPNYVPPNPPITDEERNSFQAFHGPRTQTYACVLPGEIVRQCVSQMRAGVLDPVALLNIQQLIVDEFQDLNPLDLDFVDQLAGAGAQVFVAGDDDQSIYSFRFASPGGIQNFVGKYPRAGQHTLSACFRCTPSVLATAEALIAANPLPNRIAKNHVSLYAAAAPPVGGVVHRWRFADGYAEARAIADSCGALIRGGMKARDILILLSNKRIQLQTLETELARAGVEYEGPRAESFRDTDAGRLVLAIVRIVCETNDYVAHRVILGLRPGVGVGTCNSLAEAVVAQNLNYRAVFYQPIAAGAYSARVSRALMAARGVVAQLAEWRDQDQLQLRIEAIAEMITPLFGAGEADRWRDFARELPPEITIEELRDFLWADTDEQQARLLEAVHRRLQRPIPEEGMLPQRVRVMSMHGAKGLSARVVFIPGLEEEILPGPKRAQYPGLVLEAARLLYVSITRARAACAISYAVNRVVYGRPARQAPSRFAAQLNGAFVQRNAGLDAGEVQRVLAESAGL
jgi:DNA helicase-2/ATP-dependent DNA helicase PcrA